MYRPSRNGNGEPGNGARREVVAAIEAAMAGAGPIPARLEARLGADLGMSSLAVARLAGILQKRRGRLPLPFHTLFLTADGELLPDIRVGDVVAFMERHRAAAKP